MPLEIGHPLFTKKNTEGANYRPWAKRPMEASFFVKNLSSSATSNLNYGSIFVEGSIVNILGFSTICIAEVEKRKDNIVKNLGVLAICNLQCVSGKAEGNFVRKLKVSTICNPHYRRGKEENNF